MVFSLIIAIGLWAYVMWDTDPVVTQTIPAVHVQVLNAGSLEQRGLVILDQDDFTVDIKVSGKKRDIAAMNISDISVTADAGGYGEGEAVIPITLHTLDTINVVDVRPSKLTVTIDRLVRVEKPIRVNLNGDVPADVEIGKIDMNSSSIQVSGANTYVEKVAYVEATVNVADITDTQSMTSVKLEALDAAGNIVDNVSVVPKSTEASTILYYTKEVPLETELSGDLGMLVEGEILSIGDMTAPETVKIRGSKAAISSIQTVKGTVDINGVTETGTFDIVLDLPENVSLANGVVSPVAEIAITGHEEDPTAPDEDGEGTADDTDGE